MLEKLQGNKNIKRELTQNNEAKKNIVPFRQAKKKTIMEIILNDNLSDSEKAMRCEAILKIRYKNKHLFSFIVHENRKL